jgi:hypothetical protein
MSETKKYKLLWGVLILFAGLNIWLLYGKTSLQQQVNMLQAENLHKNGVLSQMTEPVRLTPADSELNYSLNSIGLVVLFTSHGCKSCVVAEIEYLNRWHQKFDEHVQVYFLGHSKQYLEQFGAEFPFRKIDSANDLFNVSLPIGNPIAAVVDENNYVQAIHTNDLSRPGSKQRRANFYRRVESLFNAVYGE